METCCNAVDEECRSTMKVVVIRTAFPEAERDPVQFVRPRPFGTPHKTFSAAAKLLEVSLNDNKMDPGVLNLLPQQMAVTNRIRLK